MADELIINFAKLEQRVESMANKIDKVDDSMEKIYNKLNERFTDIEVIKGKLVLLEVENQERKKENNDTSLELKKIKERQIKHGTIITTFTTGVAIAVGWFFGR